MKIIQGQQKQKATNTNFGGMPHKIQLYAKSKCCLMKNENIEVYY